MMSTLQQLFRFQWRDQQATLKLAMPIMLAQLIYAIGPFVNILLAAKLGHQSLAAAALVSVVFFTLVSTGWGALSSVGILSAHHYGANKHENIVQVFQQGLIAAAVISIPTTWVTYNAPHIMLLLGQNPALIKLATPYYHALAWAMPTMYLGCIPLEMLIGLGKTKIIFIYSLIETPLNVLIKYALTYGKWGLPKLGLAGIGWGIAIICWVFLFMYLFYVIWDLRKFQPLRWRKQQWHHLKEIFQVGWPMGFTYLIEVGFFSFMTITMGHFGNEALSGYQIAAQFMALFSALTFGIGQATISRAGRALGAKNKILATQACISGIHVGWWLSLIAAAILSFFPRWIISIDINPSLASNAVVVHYAKYFLLFGALYLIIDGTRIISACILQAYKDMRFAMYSSLIGFWLMGSLLALCLAYILKIGPFGLMSGSLLGATIAMLILQVRYFKKHHDT